MASRVAVSPTTSDRELSLNRTATTSSSLPQETPASKTEAMVMNIPKRARAMIRVIYSFSELS